MSGNRGPNQGMKPTALRAPSSVVPCQCVVPVGEACLLVTARRLIPRPLGCFVEENVMLPDELLAIGYKTIFWSPAYNGGFFEYYLPLTGGGRGIRDSRLSAKKVLKG